MFVALIGLDTRTKAGFLTKNGMHRVLIPDVSQLKCQNSSQFISVVGQMTIARQLISQRNSQTPMYFVRFDHKVPWLGHFQHRAHRRQT